jgi:hypothetical protein
MKQLIHPIAAIVALLLSACASSSGVVPIGPDTFLVSRQAGSGFTGLGSLKADAFREAGRYCTDQNKFIRVVNTTDSSPPYVLGNFPRTEIQFMCLESQDSELTRPKMQAAPASVVNIQGK